MGPLCSRSGCGGAAVATFSFDGAAGIVWLDPFPGPVRGAGALCSRHADALTPPRRWQLQDRRGPTPPLWTDRPAGAPAPRPRRQRRAAPAHDTTEPETLPFEGATPAVAGGSALPADSRSDLDRLLEARTPLLARAFQGAQR